MFVSFIYVGDTGIAWVNTYKLNEPACSLPRLKRYSRLVYVLIGNSSDYTYKLFI